MGASSEASMKTRVLPSSDQNWADEKVEEENP